jgi:trehalose 6-phosphate synthase
VDSINDNFGSLEWQPVQVLYENNYAQAIAGMYYYDVLMVNPLVDGMNLVAKEGPLVNKGDGVLLISEMAGAHEQLKEYSLNVSPTDLEGTVNALHTALTMPLEERRQRANALKALIQEEDIVHWLESQFRDLMAISEGR